jgi:hypothetical protein
MDPTFATSPFRRVGPDALEVRGGSGCHVALGLPMALIGGAVVAAALGLVRVPGRETADPSALTVMTVMGSLLGLAGLAILLARGGIRIDRTEGSVVSWWGFAVPLHQTRTPLAPFDRVVIGRDRNDDGPDRYPVRLDGPAGVEPLKLVTPASHQQARAAAEDLGRLLRLPVDDESSGETVRREAERLDEMLRERLRRAGPPPSPLLPAAPLRSRVTPGPGGVTIELERLRLPFATIIEATVAAVFIIVVAGTFGRMLWSPAARPLALVVGGGIALLIVVRLAAATRLATRVLVTREQLRVEERYLLKRVVVEIPVAELEELELPRRLPRSAPTQGPGPGELEQAVEAGRLPDGRPLPSWVGRLARLVPTPGIAARSDRVAVTFLEGVPEQELRYLHALFLQAIA